MRKRYTLAVIAAISIALSGQTSTGVRDTVVPPTIQATWATRGLKYETVRGQAHLWDSSKVTAKVRSWIKRQGSSA